MEYQHKSNNYMQGKYQITKINMSDVPIVHESLFAGASRVNNKSEERNQRMSIHHQPYRG